MTGSKSMPPRIQPAATLRESSTIREDALGIARSVMMLAALLCVVAAFGAVAKFCLDSGFAWRCPIMALFHLPCPSCGTTRALAALWDLRLVDAWRLNPLMVSALLLSGIGYLGRHRLATSKQWGWIALGAAVFANWVYLLLYLPR
jgi:hypothetical protein